jgi:hypothetical protein
LSVYIGKPGQAMEVSEIATLRLDAAFCEATSREHGTVYYVEYSSLHGLCVRPGGGGGVPTRGAAGPTWLLWGGGGARQTAGLLARPGDCAGVVGRDKPPGCRPDQACKSRGRLGVLT